MSEVTVHVLPPQLNDTSGSESQGYEYRPCDESYTADPETLFQNVFAILVGALMIVLPESMIVSNLVSTFLPLTDTDAPSICQKPVSVESVWYSKSPE